MARSLENLIEKYGVPYLVIPNTPRVLSRDERRGVFSGPAVTGIDVATALHQRIPVGEEAFLLVKAQVDVPLNDFGDLETRLERDGVQIVEYRRWQDERVRLTLETDVTPITRDDIIHAVRRRRVMSVSDWRSMGDGYVDFAVATPGSLADEDGYHFYFPSAPGAPGLTGEELPASGSLNPWDLADDFFDFYKDYFTREYVGGSRPEAVADRPHAPSPDLAAREAAGRRRCSICSRLSDHQTGFQKIGREEQATHLPDAADSLRVVRDLVPDCNGVRQLKQCPECATYYLYREEYEFLIGGGEDEQQLTRVTPEKAIEHLRGSSQG
jgi:hypothetical protein